MHHADLQHNAKGVCECKLYLAKERCGGTCISWPGLVCRSSHLALLEPTVLSAEVTLSMWQGKTGYDKNAKQTSPVQPALTRRKELFVGRLAMVGFASALIGEVA